MEDIILANLHWLVDEVRTGGYECGDAFDMDMFWKDFEEVRDTLLTHEKLLMDKEN